VVFFERAADAPPPAASPQETASLRTRPIRELDAQQAYLEALDRDTLQDYLDLLAAYPDDAMAKRVRAIVAARREAIVSGVTPVSSIHRKPIGPICGAIHEGRTLSMRDVDLNFWLPRLSRHRRFR
jgi:hypothetical protein